MQTRKCEKSNHAKVMITPKTNPNAVPVECCVCTLEKYQVLYGEMPWDSKPSK